MTSKHRHLTYNITYIAMCVALLSVCSWIAIPLTVTLTLQLLAVFFIAAISDWKQSLAAILLYLCLGLIGLPIFAGFQGGPSVLLGASGGFLIGFLSSALIISLSVRMFGKRTYVLVASMLASLTLCYALGVLWYMLLYMADAQVSVFSALCICVFPFIAFDIFKIFLAVSLVKKLEPYLLRFKT